MDFLSVMTNHCLAPLMQCTCIKRKEISVRHKTFLVTALTIPLFVLLHPPSPWLSLFYEAVVAVLRLFSVQISKEICSFDLLLEKCWAHCITVNLTHTGLPKDLFLFFICEFKLMRNVTRSVMTWWMVLQILSYINPTSTYWSVSIAPNCLYNFNNCSTACSECTPPKDLKQAWKNSR